MTSLKDIKTRINSVKSTQKITRAMKMVAAAKVKKAENTVKASRPFTSELNSMFKKLLDSVGTYNAETLKIKSAIDNYPELLKIRETKTAGLLVITSNKGLAGAYNANIIRKTIQTISEYNKKGIKTILFIIGQKGISTLQKRCKNLNCEIAKTYLAVANEVSPENAQIVIEDIAEYFVSKKIDKITTTYTDNLQFFVVDYVILDLGFENVSNNVLNEVFGGSYLLKLSFEKSKFFYDVNNETIKAKIINDLENLSKTDYSTWYAYKANSNGTDLPIGRYFKNAYMEVATKSRVSKDLYVSGVLYDDKDSNQKRISAKIKFSFDSVMRTWVFDKANIQSNSRHSPKITSWFMQVKNRFPG